LKIYTLCSGNKGVIYHRVRLAIPVFSTGNRLNYRDAIIRISSYLF
jgi:hypothetical protein